MAKYKYTLKFDKKDERDFFGFSPSSTARHCQSGFTPVHAACIRSGRVGELHSQCVVRFATILCHEAQRQNGTQPLVLYWHERELEGTVDGMKVLKKLGVCPEKHFPYVIEKVYGKTV
jgi:hypothetical protein